MQTPSLLIGQSDFKSFRESGSYYVDKSRLIAEVIASPMQVILLPRPRRFGKTLNLSMLRYFFERSAPGHAALFTGLSIADSPYFAEHQGRCPVIYLTFKDVKSTRWEECFQRIQYPLTEAYNQHRYLRDDERLSLEERSYFQSILEMKAAPADYEQALQKLSELLHRCHQQKVVLLLDEYDTPIQAGYTYGYYDEVIAFMRNLLSGGFKDNPHLFKGVLTGILRVAKESIFSGLNNLGVYTLLAQEFNQAFGFTETEVEALLAAYGLTERYAEVASWYNGYCFGGETIYNPWSVLNYIGSKDKVCRPYWLNTASTELIEQLVTHGGAELRTELEDLLAGQPIVRPIYDNIVLRDLERRDDLLWSFLLFSGYLKVIPPVAFPDRYALAVPNYEVKLAYRTLIDRWFLDKVRFAQLETLLAALEQGDARVFERMLRTVVLEVMSYHDLSGEPEKVYQALVLGMLIWLAPKYDIRTNRESGYGRYDMMFKPKTPGQRGILLEFKRVYEDETPETVLAEALQQIHAKAYTTELAAAGVTEALCLAVAFRGKELWIKQEITKTEE